MSETVVVNKRRDEFDVYIGRGSKFGNPFVIGKDGDRADVIELYREWLHKQIDAGHITADDLRGLYGKRLGCFCAPLPCHGDILKESAEWVNDCLDPWETL